MNKNEIIKKVSGTVNKVGFKLKKHSPEILIVAGVIGTVVSGIMACKATTKVSGVVDKTKNDIDEIHEATEKGFTKTGETYLAEDSKKDLTIIYVQTGVKLAKLYAPSVILGALSITSILTSHNVMRKRNIALAAAYTAIDKSYKDYRKRAIERFGDEVDKELRSNIKAKTFEEVEVDKNGKEKTVQKTVNVAGDLPSDYARYFDSSVTGWENNHDYNMMFLRAKEAYANDKLKADGFVYLNDVYYELGIPKTKAGQIVGWVYKPNEPNYQGDNFVDFGIRTIMRETSDGGYEETILLDFNPDGNILDLM